jgi:hypothetical protein
MNEEKHHPPEKDLTATKPISGKRSERESGADDEGPEDERPGGRRGGPYGNPDVDEETLRKEQEERRRRGGQ